jgi:hypothetical protein
MSSCLFLHGKLLFFFSRFFQGEFNVSISELIYRWFMYVFIFLILKNILLVCVYTLIVYSLIKSYIVNPIYFPMQVFLIKLYVGKKFQLKMIRKKQIQIIKITIKVNIKIKFQ